MTERIKNFCEILKEDEAALVTSDINRIYLSGFKSSAGNVLVTKNSAYLLIDFRYFEKAKNEVQGLEVILCERLYPQITEILKQNNIKTVFVENETTTLSTFERITKNLPDFEVSDSKIVSSKLSEMRMIKTEQEVNDIKAAQKITDETFDYICTRIRGGVSEKEIALDMEFYMRKKGSEGVSFDFIVVSGKNSSLPHGVPTDKLIEKGDFITMDFGAVVNGYRSDMTRTVALGEVSDKQREVYNTVLKAQLESLKAIKAGVKCCDVDKIARDIIADKGYGKCFGHGLGHSVGLEIHESPALSPRDESLLQSGMIMTVEPGIYIENEFGVRIEDMVFVTEKGCVNLTNSPKELIIL